MKRAISVLLISALLAACAVPVLAEAEPLAPSDEGAGEQSEPGRETVPAPAAAVITMADVTALFGRVLAGDNTVTLKDVTRLYQEMKAQHQHAYVPRIVKEPGCTEPGETRYECSCGESYTEYPAALGHAWSDWVIDQYPSCATEGSRHQSCTRCGQTETQALPAAHSWNANHTCNNCGIMDIASAEAEIDAYAVGLDRDPKIVIDPSLVSGKSYMFSMASFSANDYSFIVEAGKSCVDDIINQMTSRHWLKSVKASITNQNGVYTVRVYYQHGDFW